MTKPTEFRAKEAQAFVEGLSLPEEVQEVFLREQIVGPNIECAFGREHDFASIRSIADYQRAVPIAHYEQFAPAIDRIVHGGEQGLLTTAAVKRFFVTSGSTSRPKYVPVTSLFVRNKSRAFGIYWAAAFETHPAVKRGRMVTNFSDSGEPQRTPGGLPSSSESAYWAGVTRATQLKQAPIIPKCVAQVAGTDARYYAIGRILLEESFTAIMTLNPSTILLLFDKIRQYAPQLVDDVAAGGIEAGVASKMEFPDEVRAYVAKHYRGNRERADALRAAADGGLLAHRVWNELALAICWRSPMLTPYIELLQADLHGIAQRDYIMMASEGVMAIPVQDRHSGGALAVGVHFYEFIPEEQADDADPDVLLPHELELGKTYVVVLTNGSGLYRYNIGDVVRVTGFMARTPCIEFLHRAGATCSLTGEKLTEEQVTGAVAVAAAQCKLEIESFTVVPAATGFPRYVALVEFKDSAANGGGAQPGQFAARFDRALAESNVEYGSKRSSQRLAAPELWIVAPGSFAAQRQRRVDQGTSDSQIKPTHLSRNAALAKAFEIVEKHRAD